MNSINNSSDLKNSSIFKHLLYILIISISISYLYSCNAWYEIPLTNESDTLSISSNCGTIDIRLANYQGGPFYFWQDYDLRDTVFLYKDSIEVYFKNEKYNCFNVGTTEESLAIFDSGTARIGFIISDHPVKKDDIITVIFGGYIYCKSQKINIDTLTLIMKEDLTVPGPNLF